MKNLLVILCLCSLLCGCKEEEQGISFGTVEYYPSFLWVDDSLSSVVKTMECDFSIDAQRKNSFADFQFVDNEGKAISTDIMQVRIDGEPASQNSFRVYSDVKTVNMEFVFSPDASDGKYQGYLKLIGHDLDRIDSNELQPGDTLDLLQWTLHYDKSMNPLALVLLIVGIVVISFLVLWFAFIKWLLFPVIKVSRVNINGVNVQYIDTKRINRCRKVVFTSKRCKQGFFNKVFLGEIRYVVNEVWDSNWEIYPGRRRKTVKLMLHGNYSVTPMVSSLSSMQECTIIKKDNKQVKISIN